MGITGLSADYQTLSDIANDGQYLKGAVLRELLIRAGEDACVITGSEFSIDATIWDEGERWTLQLGDAPMMVEIAKLSGVLERVLAQFDRETFWLFGRKSGFAQTILNSEPGLLLSGGQLVTYDRLVLKSSLRVTSRVVLREIQHSRES